MAQLSNGPDENGDLALTVDFDDSDYEAPRVSVRVDYRHVPDLAAEHPDVADDPTWDPEDAEAWHFQVEGRAVEHETWSVLMEGYCDALPEAAAVAIHLISEELPVPPWGAVKHRIDGSAEAFAEAFGEAFDLERGNPDLLPPDMKIDRVREDPAP